MVMVVDQTTRQKNIMMMPSWLLLLVYTIEIKLQSMVEIYHLSLEKTEKLCQLKTLLRKNTILNRIWKTSLKNTKKECMLTLDFLEITSKTLLKNSLGF